MKKRWMLGLTASLLAFSMLGCGKNEETTTETLTTVEMTEEMKNELSTEEQATTEADTAESTTEAASEEKSSDASDPMTMYADKITEYCNLIANFSYDTVIGEGMMGVYEMSSYMGTKDAARSTGYAFRDLNGDNVPELIVGYIDDQATNKGTTVWAVYAYENNSTKLVLEGYTRNAFFVNADNTILNQASSGAAYYGYGIYKIDANNKLNCQEYYFSSDEETDHQDVYYYHSNVDDWNIANAEKLDIDPDAFYAKSDELISAADAIEFTPFATFAKEHNITIPEAN